DKRIKLDIAAGNISGGGTAAVGAAVSIPIINKNTTAFIGNSAHVNAKGMSAADVKTGVYSVTNIDPRFKAPSAITGGNTINIGYDHGWSEQQEVLYDAGDGTAISGLTDGKVYYAPVDGLGPQQVQLRACRSDDNDCLALHPLNPIISL